MTDSLQFPPSFEWGCATAAFQIEGGALEGGKLPSIWDDFCAQPGRIKDASDGLVACDHFHRFREDVALMADLGVPFTPLIRLDVPSYQPDALPPELEAIPAIKPGSRAA